MFVVTVFVNAIMFYKVKDPISAVSTEYSTSHSRNVLASEQCVDVSRLMQRPKCWGYTSTPAGMLTQDRQSFWRDISRLCSIWSSSYITVLSLVESFKVMKYFHHFEPSEGL